MGIKFRCHACDKKLHVKAFLAGRRGVCPKCGAKVRIPMAGDGASPDSAAVRDATRQSASAVVSASAVGAHHSVPATITREVARSGASTESIGRAPAGAAVRTTDVYDPIAEAPDAVWYVRPPTGGQFGPADGTIMRRWLTEGRVSAEALVWREGWPDWKSAGPVFPMLEGPDLLAPAASQTAAAADARDGDFTFTKQQPPAGRHNSRAHSTSFGRNVAIVAAIVMLCVALLVALVIVLR